MNEQEQKQIAELLRESLRPVNRELNRDLWPQMLRRLDERPSLPNSAIFSGRALVSVPWFDWVLLALLIAGLCLFPKSIPLWLYQL